MAGVKLQPLSLFAVVLVALLPAQAADAPRAGEVTFVAERLVVCRVVAEVKERTDTAVGAHHRGCQIGRGHVRTLRDPLDTRPR